MNKKHFILIWLLICLTGLGPLSAYAQTRCQQVIKSEKVDHKKKSIKNDPLVIARSKMKPLEFQKFKMWYLSHYFFNKKVLLDHQFSSQNQIYPQVYNKKGEKPFLSYLIARDLIFSMSTQEVLSVDGLKKIHNALLKKYPEPQNEYLDEMSTKNSEGTLDQDLGVIRRNGVLSDNNLNEQVKKPLIHLNNNSFVPSPKNETKLFEQNPYLSKYKNKLDHADPQYWVKLQHRLSPSLISKLKKSQNYEDPVLVEEYVTELLNSIINDYKSHQSVADFIHDFLSLHPFNNGNGRLARLLTERLTFDLGQPSPLWTYSGIDITLSKSEFSRVLADSIEQSKKWNQLLVNALKKNQFDYQNQITPFLLPTEFLNQNAVNPKLVLQNMDLTTFNEFKKNCVNCNSDQQVIQKFIDWNLKISHFTSSDQAKVSFIPDDFIENFADLSKPIDPKNYKKDKTGSTVGIHRGYVTPEIYKLDDVIQFFLRPNKEITGMGVKPQVRSIQDSLKKYNQLLLQPDRFIKKLEEHWVGESNDYWTSGLSSWSASREISVSFANFEYLDTKKGSAVVVSTLNPLHGSIDAVEFKSRLNLNLGFDHEVEHTIAGGIDPRAIYQVFVKTAQMVDNIFWGHKENDHAIIATRLSHDEIKIVIAKPIMPQYNAYSDPTQLKVNEWRIESELRVILTSDGKYQLTKAP